MERNEEERKKISVAEVASRFDAFGDHSLAERLQQEEYDSHYQLNRAERRNMGTDTRLSKEEQMKEAERNREERRRRMAGIEETDEEIARRLQMEYERELEEQRERARRQEQEDAELAFQIATGRTASPHRNSEQIPTHEEAQNHVNELVATTNTTTSSSLIDMDPPLLPPPPPHLRLSRPVSDIPSLATLPPRALSLLTPTSPPCTPNPQVVTPNVYSPNAASPVIGPKPLSFQSISPMTTPNVYDPPVTSPVTALFSPPVHLLAATPVPPSQSFPSPLTSPPPAPPQTPLLSSNPFLHDLLS